MDPIKGSQDSKASFLVPFTFRIALGRRFRTFCDFSVWPFERMFDNDNVGYVMLYSCVCVVCCVMSLYRHIWHTERAPAQEVLAARHAVRPARCRFREKAYSGLEPLKPIAAAYMNE